MSDWTADRVRGALHRRIGTITLAIVAYVPLLLTHRGKLGADTKAYLYLDPGQLLSKAPYMWDPTVGMGTVTHQNIGYLFPMGPYYWLCEQLGLPDWIAQRLWVGSIIFIAGLGVKYLLRVLKWSGPGATVAALAYATSPYLLHYVYKHSVILLPFAALPWLIALCAQSLRHKGWRYPALFALVALASGGVNATSLVLVMLGPLLWTIHAVFVERELSLSAALPPLLRIGALTLATSLWWIAGLAVQGGYGIDILAYTETYRTVASASTAAEVSRGLGYWFFYGVDTQGPWFESAVTMTENVAALGVSLLVPAVAIASVLWTRWRYRVFFVSVGLVGLVVSIGSHPFDEPSPYGALFKSFMETDSGLALRSTPRAVPLLALAVAVFLGAGLAAAAERFPARQTLLTAAAFVMLAANITPFWTGDLVDSTLERPEDVPAYWTDLGDALDTGNSSTRVLEVPGSDFADYRWGATVDPITPGLTDRDYAARELVPYGTLPSADLVNAADAPFQALDHSSSALSPLLRLMGVGDLVVRADLQYEKYRTPRPRALLDWVGRAEGLGTPTTFGEGTPANRAPSSSPLIDSYELGLPSTAVEAPPVATFPVEDALDIVRAVPPESPQLVSGNAAGIVSMAEAGLLDPEHILFYSGSVTDKPADLEQLLDEEPVLVITDSNRRSARRWGSTRDNDGYTEAAGETPVDDVSDNRIDLFERGDSVYTTAEQRGDFGVRASGYGNPFTYTPSDRAFNAVDGDPATAWKVGAFSDVTGEWIELTARGEPLTTPAISLSQPFGNRHVTQIRLTFDDESTQTVSLGEESLGGGSQRVELDVGQFTTIRIEILDTNVGQRGTYQGISGTGFAEIALEDVDPLEEFIVPPSDLLDALEGSLEGRDASFVFRRRTSTPESQLQDVEMTMKRSITLSEGSIFALTGQARLNPDVSDAQIDSLLSNETTPRAEASSRLYATPSARASQAFDDDSSTWWQSGFFPGPGEWLEVDLPPDGSTVDSITIATDGGHSIPLRAHFEVDGEPLPGFRLDAPASTTDSTTTFEIEPVEVEGTTLRLVIDEIRDVVVPDWLTGLPNTLPVAVATVGTSGDPIVSTLDRSASVPTRCVDDLVRVGEQTYAISLDGSVEDAESGQPIAFTTCENGRVLVGDGRTDVVAGDGRVTGVDIDLITLGTDTFDPADDAAAGEPAETGPVDDRPAPAMIDVERTSPVAYEIDATADEPYWIVLGQSFNDGWSLLTTEGDDLGEPRLVNGYANGWLVDPAEVGSSASLTLSWTPQRTVSVALWLSLVAFLGCCVLAMRAAGPSTVRAREPMAPQPVSFADNFGAPPALGAIAVATGIAFVTGFAVIGPFGAIALAGATFLALRVDRCWAALRVGSVLIFGLASAYVVAKQLDNAYPLDFDWPEHFERAHWPLTFAWLLVGVEVTVEVLRAGWRRDAGLRD